MANSLDSCEQHHELGDPSNVTIEYSRAREIVRKLKLLRQEFAEVTFSANGHEGKISDDHIDDVRHEHCSFRESRLIARTLKERINKLARLGGVLRKSGRDNCSFTDDLSVSSLTEVTEPTSPSCSSLGSPYSINPLVRLVIENQDQLPVLDEFEDSASDSTTIRGAMRGDDTPRKSKKGIQPREMIPLAPSLPRRIVLRKKIDDFFRNLPPMGPRFGDETVDLTYSSSSDDKSYPSEIRVVVDGRTRLRELYWNKAQKLRQHQLLAVSQYRSNRHGRDQVNRMVLDSSRNIPERRMKIEDQGHKKRRKGLVNLRNDVAALRKMPKRTSRLPTRPSPRRPPMDECDSPDAQFTSDSNTSGWLSNTSSPAAIDIDVLLPSLSEESVDDLYLQSRSILRTLSFCGSD